MKLLAHDTVDMGRVAKLVNRAQLTRSGGFHITELRDEGYRIAGRAAGDYSNLRGVAEMGLVFEAAIRPVIEEDARERGLKFVAGEERTIGDDIVTNPDGWLLKGQRVVCGVEVKLRFAAFDGDPTTNTDWMVQVMAVCKALRVLDMLMYVGSIKMPVVALHRTHLSFSVAEVESNWRMLSNSKQHIIEKGWTDKHRCRYCAAWSGSGVGSVQTGWKCPACGRREP